MLRARVIAAAAILTAAATVAGSNGAVKPVAAADFERQQFDRSTVVDNRWFPLKPGTQMVFTGSALEGKDRFARRLIVTVTDLTKVVAGVRTVVVWERDFSEGEL